MLTTDQLEYRKNGLGGSEAMAYCGKDPRRTPLQLYLEKIGITDNCNALNTRMEWGNRSEPMIRDWLSEKLGGKIFNSPPTVKSQQYPFMIGNLDGILDDQVIEVKNVGIDQAYEYGESGSSDVPLRHLLQVMHYMIVTGFRRAHIGALIGGNDPRHYIIDYDEEIAEKLIYCAKIFWNHIIEKNPPDVTTLEDCALRWKSQEGTLISANSDIVTAIESYKILSGARKKIEDEMDQIEFEIKKYMQESDILINPQGINIATWKEQKRSFIDSKNLAEIYPDLYSQFQKTTKFRTFRVK